MPNASEIQIEKCPCMLQVVARISSMTRPAIMLSEMLTAVELERLIMLSCNEDYNSGNVLWGGSWAGHAVTCLLQDILDGQSHLMTARHSGQLAAS